MKTLYLTDSSANIWVDIDNGTSGNLGPVDRYDIRNAYLVEEPMHVIYNYGDEHKEFDVKKGDILVTFYSREKHKVGVIKSKEWKENIVTRQKAEQKAKEEWAKKQAMGTITEPCAECCCKCDNAA